ncbi:MAG: GNAT family N-acetyltransferase [Flavobacteriales bacterium]|nr:MAG: GNAT family N-acetyltransferase [Flavobacteriales bacterium]
MFSCVKSKRENYLLKSQNIFLRKLESTDVDLILEWENNIENWEVSGTVKPFTKEEIEQFVNGNHDIYENKQIRYVICLVANNRAIGALDLFEFDSQNKTVGVGVLIAETENRRTGYASDSLNLICDYCSNELNVVTIFCNILKDNIASIRLFEKNGFQFVEERILFKKPINYYELKL